MGEIHRAFADTVADDAAENGALPPSAAPGFPRGSHSTLSLSARSTVLPRMIQVRGAGPGDENTPRFAPIRVLGAGALGEVTLVQDNDIQRPVALKRLHDNVRSEEVIYRFAQEIRTVGQLEHPNIAPVHDVGVDDTGAHYFVMRYVEGETLQAIITRLRNGDAEYHARYTFTSRAQLFFGVLHAIAYAHARGIIHRDIKPANIIVGPYGEVVVMDWGIAKQKGSADIAVSDADRQAADNAPLYETRVGSLVGTPAYMSPEQARGEIDKIDERSDIYGLSALFYELLALEHYLKSCGSMPELLAEIVSDEHVMAAYVRSSYQPPVPAELSWFIEKGLAKAPEDRFQSVSEMLIQLERVLAGAFPIQCPVTFMKRVGGGGIRFADRHPLLSIVGMLLAVATVGFAAFDLVSRFG